MNRSTPQMRSVVERLMDQETRESTDPETQHLAAFHACEKLRVPLVSLMGTGGSRALLSRALALAAKEARGLHSVQVKADGSLGGLRGHPAAESFSRDGAVLLAHLLELLVAFIGESLTVRLTREIWPRLSLGDIDFGKGDPSEEKDRRDQAAARPKGTEPTG